MIEVNAGDPRRQHAQREEPDKLSEAEVDRITAFMHALTGEQPEVTYPILPPSVATTPRPQP